MLLHDAEASASSAIVTVTPNLTPPGGGESLETHNIGVWYNGATWAIFNQSGTSMPPGPAFNVSYGGLFATVQTATSSNTAGDWMLPSPAWLYSSPNAILIVTPNFNPPGHFGVYDDHPIGVHFTGSQWAIYHDDVTAIPQGASYNVRFASTADGAFIHCASASNVFGNYTIIDEYQPNITGQPGARLFVTHNWNPPGQTPTYLPHPIGVAYDASIGNWEIYNADSASMPTTACFNVMVRP